MYRTIDVPVDGEITATLDWDQPTASLVLSLSRKNADGKWEWVTSIGGQKPDVLAYPATAGAWRIGVKAKKGAANYTLTLGTPDGPPDNAYVTLLFSRSEVTAAVKCVADDEGVVRLDTGVAPELASRGMTGTGTVETGVTQEHTNSCLHYKETLGASWDQLAQLRDTYGWSFTSHSRTYAKNWSTMTLDQQWNESCGSIQDLLAHGHTRGDGLFAYPHNTVTLDTQLNVVSTCFAFARKFGTGADRGPRSQRRRTTPPPSRSGEAAARTPRWAARRVGPDRVQVAGHDPKRAGRPADRALVHPPGLRAGDRLQAGAVGLHLARLARPLDSRLRALLLVGLPGAAERDPVHRHRHGPKTVAEAWGRTNYTPPPPPGP